MPAILAGAYAIRREMLQPARFLLMTLALVAAEFADLFASDLALDMRAGRESHAPVLPGSPVLARLRGKNAGIIAIIAVLLVFAGTALGLFVAWTGPRVLVLFGVAAACALLYAFQPFPGSFLATALVPSAITGGAFAVMSGGWDLAAFLAGAPICFVSSGVILTYRFAYIHGRRSVTGRSLVLLSYAASLAAVVALVSFGVFRWPALFALAPAAILAALAARLMARESADHVPATSVGVILHATLSLTLAGFMLL
jgi:1,4-dihydroxy-2-naphthoate octaprenyltransferase